MAEKIVVKAEKRESGGRNVNRRLRAEGRIPVVVYGGGGESIAATAGLKDLAAILPACASALWKLRRDPRVPRRAKVALLLAGIWVVSPIDLIPEFLPVIGPLDDVVVVALALRYAARRVPRDVLAEAWTAEPRLLDRLMGSRA